MAFLFLNMNLSRSKCIFLPTHKFADFLDPEKHLYISFNTWIYIGF